MANSFKFIKPSNKIKNFYSVNKKLGDSSNWQIDENLQNYSTNYFERFDTYEGLFNTQQFIGSIDFNDFSKHCFFNSAVSKVEYTFREIYDNFPIDGSEQELNDFYRNLDGFQKYIYNKIDKNIGYLKFNKNSFIEIINKSGYFTSFKRNDKIISKISKPILNPKSASFSFDFRMFVVYDETVENNYENQVIFQYLDKTNNKKNGFTFFIKNFEIKVNEIQANMVFHVSNTENDDKLLMNFSIPVNTWQHISISIINDSDFSNSKKLKLWINAFEQLNIQKIEKFSNKNSLDIDNNINFLIGKGSSHTIANNIYNLSNNTNLFYGFLDEFRFLHQEIDNNWVLKYKDENIYAQDNLKLYFRFNEPTGIYEKNNFCFDSSGNSLHSNINFQTQPNNLQLLRSAVSNLRYNPQDPFQVKPHLKFENDENNPCLIPTYEKNKILNLDLLEEARDYDLYNPNLIFKLFPKHLFEQGAKLEGLDELFKNKGSSTYYIYDTQSDENDALNLPGQQREENSQTFAKLLLIWARFFDEIKIYLDVMPKLINIDYNNVEDQNNAVNFFIPLMAKKAGFKFKEIMESTDSKLLDGYIIGSDGVDKSQFTLRFVQNELWKRILINSRDMLQSKGTKNAIKSIFNSMGIIPNEFYKFKESGKKQIKFTENSLIEKVKNIKFLNFDLSNNNLKFNLDLSYLKNKNLLNFTNDSYAIEFYFYYHKNIENKQINETLFSIVDHDNNDLLKIVFDKQVNESLGTLKLQMFNINEEIDELTLTNINLLNNKVMHICLNFKKIISRNEHQISLHLQDCLKNNNRVNTSNLFINADYKFFQNNNFKNIQYGYNNTFNGQISNIRLWKSELNEDDLITHGFNINSLSNYNFQFLKYDEISNLLLLNVSLNEKDFYENNNQLLPIDQSENNVLPYENDINYPFIIYGENGLNPIDYLTFQTLIVYENDLSFDDFNTDNRVYILGFQDDSNANYYNVDISPVYEVNYNKQKKNDVRFSIEMSNVKHLNEDIGKLFNSIDYFSDIIADFGTLNDPHYNYFEKFSDFYFKRIKSNTIQITPLYSLYQVFDNILTEMLEDFISSRVKFNNNVYVIESHAFERHKFHYKFMESHIMMSGGDIFVANRGNSSKTFNYLNQEGRRL